MRKQRFFIRSFRADVLLESFLVGAVASVLAIRLFLSLTGYPQIGGGGLHIAHMLWGGLLMLAAIIILLSFLSRAAEQVAAVLGGIGFGTFIDEVGKFVTSDNDYFYRPAVALIYIIFILIYLAAHAIHRRRHFSREEYLVNALREMEEVAMHHLDEEERKRSVLYLERSDPANPLVAALRDALSRVRLAETPRPLPYARLKLLVRSFYHYVAGLRWFPSLVTAFFVAQLLFKLAYAFTLIFLFGVGWEQVLDLRVLGRVVALTNELSFIDWAQLASSLLSALFLLSGIVRIRRSRLRAFQMFERSVLVSIFLTQVFAFYKEQFSALVGLFFNIVVLAALHFMIERERAVANATVANAVLPHAPHAPDTGPGTRLAPHP